MCLFVSLIRLFLLSHIASLSVTLLDVNDNFPRFVGGERAYVNVSEGEDVNKIVLRVETTDRDRNQEVLYCLKPSNDDPLGFNFFHIDSVTG